METLALDANFYAEKPQRAPGYRTAKQVWALPEGKPNTMRLCDLQASTGNRMDNYNRLAFFIGNQEGNRTQIIEYSRISKCCVQIKTQKAIYREDNDRIYVKKRPKHA